ncbi:hypothetical protein FHT82_003060 [Rhizobium sp. BK275]|uniref:hypothetical protein n=1 Tax=unclassified Rhizobium TaxID=2613769 RepID=UPI0016130039|nr:MULTISPECIES: hypothetical protein [unclassified Rhizobium]MBB3390297.1 hypothetical protein [Rhizobium sp. BK275]MBB3409239.1 hypothetical protein [Rhizobium sp. BK316]
MSVLHKTVAAGLIALTFAGASLATADTANARPHDAFWGGVAGGVIGGVVGGAIASRPAYPGPYAYYPRPYAYYPAYPAYPAYYGPRFCHPEWRYDRWGESYRIEVCRR